MRHTNSKSHSKTMSFNSDNEMSTHTRPSPAPVNVLHRPSRRKESTQPPHPNPPLTPNTVPTPMPIPNLQPSAPASPPTPAPSPTPHQRAPAWHSTPPELEDQRMRDAPFLFSRLSIIEKEAWLASIVDACDNHSLSFLHHLVSPRLKKDPFRTLPNELCFRVSACLLRPLKSRLTRGLDFRVRGRPQNICPSLAGLKAMARDCQR
jgi:F-box and WD-40 domain protein CDC4